MALLKEKRAGIDIPEFMNMHVCEGRAVISDYSHKDDYNEVLALMAALGVKPKVQTESWCG